MSAAALRSHNEPRAQHMMPPLLGAPCRPGSAVGRSDRFIYAGQCKPCFEGMYQPKSGQAECLPCTGRTYTSMTSSQRCQACGLGRVTEQTSTDGNSRCSACRPGTVHKPGTNSCYYCNFGFYQAIAGKTTCERCPRGKASLFPGSPSKSTCMPYLSGVFVLLVLIISAFSAS